jgi:hypothetical protein
LKNPENGSGSVYSVEEAKMSKKGFAAFHLICVRPIENKDISHVLLLKNKSSPFSGWRLNSAQRDFINSLYEVDQEKR